MIPWRYTVDDRTKTDDAKIRFREHLNNFLFDFSNIHELVCSINELKVKTKLVQKMVKAFAEKKLGFRRQRACGRDRPRKYNFEIISKKYRPSSNS